VCVAMMTTTMTFQVDVTQRQRPSRPRTPLCSTDIAAASAFRPRSTDLSTCGTFQPTAANTALSALTDWTPIRRRRHLRLNGLFINRLFSLTALRASITGSTQQPISSAISATRNFLTFVMYTSKPLTLATTGSCANWIVVNSV